MTTPKIKLPVAIAVLLATSESPAQATAARAESPAGEEVVKLSIFEVTTTNDIGYQSTNAAEATRMDTPIENIPMNVTIFNQQFIEDLLAIDTSELLAYEATSVKTTENDGFLARGSSSVGTNFLNGFAQTSGFGSQPLANIERVEVIRGPAAVLYGSGGYGGTINRITKQPRDQAFTSARAIFSDHSSHRFEFDNTAPLPFFGGKTLAYRINGIYDRGYTWFGQRKEEDGIAPSLAWKVGPNTKVIFEYFYDWRESQASWETPMHAGDPHGLVTGDGAYRVTPRKVAWVYPEDFRHNTRQVASYDLRHAFSDNLQFRSQFQWETKEQDNQEVQALSDGLTILADTALMPARWRHWPRETDNYRTRNELIWKFEVLKTNHRLLVGHGWDEQYDLNRQYLSSRNNGGLTGERLTGDGRLADNQAGPLFNSYPTLTYAEFLEDPTRAGFNPNLLLPFNLFDRGDEPPLPALADRPPLYLNTHTKTYTASQSVYANDVFSFADERFFIMAGLRYSDFERRTLALAGGSYPNRFLLESAPTVEQGAHATTGSLGAVWHLNAKRTATLYANLNNSFTPEFRSQPDGSALDPEEGKQKEVGIRFNLRNGRISGLVTYFDLLQDNVTRSDPDRPGEGYFIQESGQRSTGWEFSLNARPTDNWSVFGGYANIDARNDLTGQPKDLQPKHRFTLFNRYAVKSGPLKGLNLSLGTIYVGERPLTPSTVRGQTDWGPMPDYWRVDTIVSYRLRRPQSRVQYDFSFKVNNVLDETDIYYVGSYYRYTIDPGRTWQAVVGVRF
ncbi:MAG TPA: TonB-dependent receptor plug domain-containing protein [Opitutaceae bacterium]